MKDLYLANYSYGHTHGYTQMSMHEMIQTAKEMGFQGMELVCPLDEEIAGMLLEFDMKVISTAPGFTASLDDSVAMKMYKSMGVRYVGIPAQFGNHRQALKAAAYLNEQGKKAAAQGLKLFYHNHTHEWRFDEGEYLLETILRNTDPKYVSLQMDVGWVVCAGVDPVAFIEKYPRRVELMHVKSNTGVFGSEGVAIMAPPDDLTDPAQLPFYGDSDDKSLITPKELETEAKIKSVSGAMADCIIDYEKIMTVAQLNGCQAFIIERDEHYKDPIDCIREDLTCIRKFW